MKACNRKILELFYNAKHTGRISKPDAVARVGEDDEGLVIELTWRVIGGIIADAKFRAFANPNAIAITSLMVDNMIGKSVEEVLNLGEEVIIDNLGEFLPEYLEVYDLVRELIHELYDNYLKRQNRSTNVEDEEFDYETYALLHQEKDVEGLEIKQIQRELQSFGIETESKGRGRPRKEVDANEAVELGEKRGRGRPRKVVDETEVVEIGEKRGRGRPRKEVDPNAIVEVGEKRGRGRPRKIVDESEIVEVGEKRGRGRPRKVVDETEVVEIGEKRGRGRPRKEITIALPSDLDEVMEDEEMNELINGSSSIVEETYARESDIPVIFEQSTTTLLDESEEDFDSDYDLFKSNIRNIFSGKEVSSQTYSHTVENNTATLKQEQTVVSQPVTSVETEDDEIVINNNEENVKRGRGRPRKEVDPDRVVEVGEKRGRGRPKKIVIEEVEDDQEKRGRGRPRLQPINSLTRSLTPNSMLNHSNQDIVFASKNVTTTNININVTKTTTSVEDTKSTTDDYSHNTSISEQKVEISTPYTISNDEEIELDEYDVVDSDNTPVKNVIDDDFEDDVDVSSIKDEAPSGGIQDLLRALLDD